jgi:hypothetical protein
VVSDGNRGDSTQAVKGLAKRLKLIGSAILVFQASSFLQAVGPVNRASGHRRNPCNRASL